MKLLCHLAGSILGYIGVVAIDPIANKSKKANKASKKLYKFSYKHAKKANKILNN